MRARQDIARSGRVDPDTLEQVVLVDADDREVGTAPKLEAHRLGLRHRAFSVLVRDGEGRLLLQRRATAKYHSGGLWSNSCCGHPRPGEATDAAAARRLREELGIEAAMSYLGRISYRVDFGDGMSEHEVVSVFAAAFGGRMRPDPAEVEDTAWVTGPELLADVRRRPELYTGWFRIYLDRHLDLLGLAG
ncbi:MAG TPA: isopentenyl-diphosphate Delta-isomerase [Azospirillaceae bacterium]|nr:isopentenyl-diphosphate Delta-isomerase [Azospirillaceae bacterium]